MLSTGTLRATAGTALRAPTVAYALLLALIVWLQFGPLIGLTGFRLQGDLRWALSGAVRDLLVVLLIGCGVLALARQDEPLPPSVRWALLMLVVYALMTLRSSSNPYLLALNLRKLSLVPLLYVALYLIPFTRAQTGRALGFVVITSVAVAGFGVFERLMPDSFWTDWLEVENYMAANNFDPWAKLGFYETGRFFSWDLEPWTGQALRRMVASYLEPTTFAAGMAVMAVMGLARLARGHAGLGLVMLAMACGLATLSKGFALFLLLLLAWRSTGVPGPRHLLQLTAITAAFALEATATSQLDGALSHVEGLATGIQALMEGKWLGSGIGAAGAFSEAAGDIGHESGLGTAIVQIGLAGLLPLFWVRAIARDVLQAGQLHNDPGAPWLAAWLVFWLVSYLLSASSLGVGGNALGFMMLALYLRHAAAGA
jgi:hypothetical protein